MKREIPLLLICVLVLGFIPACREDPQDVKLHQQQNAELSRLSSEISIIEAAIKDMPADMSSELKEAEQNHALQKAGVEEMNAQIAEVSDQIKATKDRLRTYRIKYQIK
jgi:peptidoglycan hydrolase CwlO-like protein